MQERIVSYPYSRLFLPSFAWSGSLSCLDRVDWLAPTTHFSFWFHSPCADFDDNLHMFNYFLSKKEPSSLLAWNSSLKWALLNHLALKSAAKLLSKLRCTKIACSMAWSGKTLWEVNEAHSERIFCCEWLEDDSIATGSEDQREQLAALPTSSGRK